MGARKRRALAGGDGLFGPDLAERIEPAVEVIGDELEVRAWQFCNRWVFLPHQRPAALRELRELVARARDAKQASADAKDEA